MSLGAERPLSSSPPGPAPGEDTVPVTPAELLARVLDAADRTAELDWSLVRADFEIHDHELPDSSVHRGPAGWRDWIRDTLSCGRSVATGLSGWTTTRTFASRSTRGLRPAAADVDRISEAPPCGWAAQLGCRARSSRWCWASVMRARVAGESRELRRRMKANASCSGGSSGTFASRSADSRGARGGRGADLEAVVVDRQCDQAGFEAPGPYGVRQLAGVLADDADGHLWVATREVL